MKDARTKLREDTLNTKVRELTSELAKFKADSAAEVAILKADNAELSRKYTQLLEEVRDLRAGRGVDVRVGGNATIGGDIAGSKSV